MSARIIMQASDVWGYYAAHKEELESTMKMIAENQEFGVEVYLTGGDDLPLIMVTADDEEIYEEEAVSYHDCTNTVGEIYDKYLSKEVIDILTGGREEILDAAEEADMIDEREMELDYAIYGLLNDFVPNLWDISDDLDEVCEDLKDHICEYLYQKHGISVYRPMYLEDEDGSDCFTEFPYPEIDFDDDED